MAIEERRDGYRVRWYTLARESRSVQVSSRREANRIDDAVREAHRAGRDYEPPPSRGEPTVEEIARAFIEAKALRFAGSTLRLYGMHLDVFARFLAERHPGRVHPVSLLARPLLDEFMGYLARADTTAAARRKGAATGDPRVGESIAKMLRTVMLMWEWADECERWPDQIPRPRRIPEDELPRSAPYPVVAPTWTEMDRCVLACRGWQRKLATWLRYTGLRVGESMLFEWSHIDMARGELMIPPELDKQGVGRVIPLHPALLDEIATWGKREGYVIPSGRKVSRKRPMQHREARGRDMARAWKLAGVREVVWKRRPDHAFRKGVKSGLVALGAHADAVDFLQGHALGAGSRGRYIDGAHLPLRETIARIPVIGSSVAGENVVALPSVMA